MKAFRRLILPIDGSAASMRGLDFALQLAQSEGAAVDVCSVINDIAIIMPMAEGALVDPGPLLEILTADRVKLTSTAVAHLRASSVPAQGTVLHGNPIDEINDFAHRQHADAFVLGTNGRNGIDRVFLGSLTAALIRIADIPVITVHADDTLLTGPMLVAIDASTASQAALSLAIDRARVSGASLQLLHVFEQTQVDRLSAALGLRPESVRRRALTDAEDALDESADRVRAAGVAFTTEIATGIPGPTILTAAERHGAGSIVIGTHGRGALERFIVGSVADAVIRNARIPVYVVHRRNGSFTQNRAVIHEPVVRGHVVVAPD